MVVLCKYTPLDVSDLPAQVLALLRLRFAQGTLKRPPALLQLGWLVHSVPIVLKVMQCDRLKRMKAYLEARVSVIRTSCARSA